MDILGGFIGVAFFVMFFVLAIFWLIFPWTVHAQLAELIKSQKSLENSESTMLHIFTKMERHLEGIKASLSQSHTTSSTPQTVYYYSSNGQQQGPLAAADLRSMHKDGLITDDTQVLLEGETEWKKYRDFLALNR